MSTQSTPREYLQYPRRSRRTGGTVSAQSTPRESSQYPRQSTRRAGTVSTQSTGVGGARKSPGAEVDGGEPPLINSVRVVVVHLQAEKVELPPWP